MLPSLEELDGFRDLPVKTNTSKPLQVRFGVTLPCYLQAFPKPDMADYHHKPYTLTFHRPPPHLEPVRRTVHASLHLSHRV